MITDTQLNSLAINCGLAAFGLIVVYHALAVNQKAVVEKESKTAAAPAVKQG